MKQRRLFILLLILLLLGIGGGLYLFKSHKKKPVKPKAPVTQAIKTAQTVPTPIPTGTPLVLKEATPTPMVLPTPDLLASPVPTPTPGTPIPEEKIPTAKSRPAETPALLQVQLPAELKLAEGTTTFLEPEISYSGKRRLNYLWKRLSGPEDKIRILNPNDATPRLILGDIEEPVEFQLQLSVTDGQTESLADLKIRAFPAHLHLVAKSNGPFIGVQPMGDKWIVARSQELEIYQSDFTPIATLPLERPIAQFYGVMGADGKGAVFIQSPEGLWAVLQRDPAFPNGVRKTDLPNQGRSIRRVVPFKLEDQPYVFALLDRGIELWNLTDPRHPTLKTTQGAVIQSPLYLTYFQRFIYVADESNLYVLDFSSGNLLASLPSGGSITSLNTFSSNGKNFLVVAIGKDRTKQGRKDYGLRLFEISSTGQLGDEKRIVLKGIPPIEKTLVIPGASKALLRVIGEKGPELRIVDLSQGKEENLSFTEPLSFLLLSDMQVGRLGDLPIVVVADGNQLTVLGFKKTAEGYQVSRLKSFLAILAAAWGQASSDGQRLWVGDEGTQNGGGTALVDGNTLRVLTMQPSSNSFPVDADFSTGAPYQAELFVAADPRAVSAGAVEGRLGLILKEDQNLKIEVSKPLLGVISTQGKIRPSSIAARGLPGALRIAVTLARESGNLSGAGLWLWDKPADQTAKVFLEKDWNQLGAFIPLQDARDVALTADGKSAIVAVGSAGVLSLDLEKKIPIAQMSLGSADWIADRVLLSHQENLVLVTFIKPATRQAMLKIFGFDQNRRMQEYGTLTGLQPIRSVEGLRAPIGALTEDDLYLFMPTGRILQIFNLSDPANPTKIDYAEAGGEIRSVTIANRFKDVFLALGSAGLEKFEFGF